MAVHIETRDAGGGRRQGRPFAALAGVDRAREELGPTGTGGPPGRTDEVAAAVRHLDGADAAFVTGPRLGGVHMP
ncbi:MULTISPECIES: hypothetical protein [Nocardiopsis]|uniref:hypothetical protein n=1 Tax=Nocardiopsis TaxID=2013 RepID=UPI0003469A90|nr:MULTISPECIES: hypothetical protein [Nocardiopsis]PWV55268.1 hypothetical protein BDW27_103272 [Nocardiopsis sp. L17-MgMaSL7]